MLLPGQMTKLLTPFPDPMTKDDFIRAMNTPLDGEPKEKDLLPALQAFDTKDCGDLTKFEVLQIFCHMNEKMPLADVERILEGGAFWTGSQSDKANIAGLHKWLTRPAKAIAIPNAEVAALAK